MSIVPPNAQDFDHSNLLLQYKIKCASQIILLQQWHQQLQQIRLLIHNSKQDKGQPKSYSDRLLHPKNSIQTIYDVLRNLRIQLKTRHTSPQHPQIPHEFNIFFFQFSSTLLRWEQILLVIISRIHKLQTRHLSDQHHHERQIQKGRFGFPTAGGIIYHPKLYYKIDNDLILLSGYIAEQAMKRLPFVVDTTIYDSATSVHPITDIYITHAFSPFNS